MNFLDKPFTFDRVVRMGITGALAYVAYLLLSRLSDVLIPFAAAAIMAYILEPIVTFFQTKARLRSRILSILVTLLLSLVVFAGVLLALVPLVSGELAEMGDLLQTLANSSDLEAQAEAYMPEDVVAWLQDFIAREEVQQLFETGGLGNLLTQAAEQVLPGIWSVLGGVLSVVSSLVGVIIILLYLIFILIDYDKVIQGWPSLLPARYKNDVLEVVYDFKDAMSRYFRAQIIIASLVGILFAIGFSIVGLPLAVVFGLLVGALNLVPYLQNVALVPAAFLALIQALETGNSFWLIGLGVLVVFGVVQLIQDAVLTPRIMGKAIGLNPAIMLLSLSIWGSLLGLFGLIIALPVTFLISSYYKKFLVQRNEEYEANELAQAVATTNDTPPPIDEPS